MTNNTKSLDGEVLKNAYDLLYKEAVYLREALGESIAERDRLLAEVEEYKKLAYQSQKNMVFDICGLVNQGKIEILEWAKSEVFDPNPAEYPQDDILEKFEAKISELKGDK